MELGEIGKTPGNGVQRVAFSNEDIAGRKFIISLMKKAGLSVATDEAANIIGTRPGQKPQFPPILFGSHIDTVPNGGKYDGSVGVVGAIACLEVLLENDIVPNHPLKVVVFTNEEGGLTGSRGMSGQLDAHALNLISQSGKSIKAGIRTLGGKPDQLANTPKRKGEISAYLELHIEQGAVLSEKGIQIGIVEGIVGFNWWDVLIEGNANHAGATPMHRRQDALVAAAHLVVEVNQLARSAPGTPVATVGKISARPGAFNVIPGSVSMGLEIRDLCREKLLSIFSQVRKKSREIARDTKTTISFKAVEAVRPAPADPAIRNVISEVAHELGLTSLTMPSGAGHDAQNMALITRMGMIFIPSIGGISHSPREFSRKEDIANGANVLLHTILQIDSGIPDLWENPDLTRRHHSSRFTA